jgi:mono/diheme cytochrome c family protein
MRLTPRQIGDLRLECGKGGLDAALLAAQLLEMVEKLQSQLDAAEALIAAARRDVAKAEAALAEQRGAAAALVVSDCQSCHNAEARAVIERLRTIVGA